MKLLSSGSCFALIIAIATTRSGAKAWSLPRKNKSFDASARKRLQISYCLQEAGNFQKPQFVVCVTCEVPIILRGIGHLLWEKELRKICCAVARGSTTSFGRKHCVRSEKLSLLKFFFAKTSYFVYRKNESSESRSLILTTWPGSCSRKSWGWRYPPMQPDQPPWPRWTLSHPLTRSITVSWIAFW